MTIICDTCLGTGDIEALSLGFPRRVQCQDCQGTGEIRLETKQSYDPFEPQACGAV